MQQRIPLAATFLTVFAVAAAWWGLSSSVGTSQPAANVMAAEGRIEGGSNVYSVGTSATGTVAELMVAPGAHVLKGQHLARIECGQIERELEARKSDLEAAEAALMRTVHGPRPEEISVGIANVNHAEARLEEAEKVLNRTMLLHEGFTVTRVQIDQAQRDARMARALLDEARARLALLKAGSRAEDISEFRQVMLSIPEDQPQMPIGLRVSVQFSPCPAGQRGTKQQP